MIRPAKYGDIPRITGLMVEAYQASRYVAMGEMDLKEAKSIVMNAIQRHGQDGAGGCCVFAAERGGAVEGFIIGVLDRCYHVGVPLMANDLMFWVSPRAGAREARELATAYRDWALANERVVEVRGSFTDAFADPEMTTKLYEALGFRWCGGIFEMTVERGESP